MRLKHWQGYGNVSATLIKKSRLSALSDNLLMTIKVKGNHEWGLIREDDNYTIKRWLLERFDKSTVDLNPYRDMKYKVDYAPSENGEEVAIYSILYGKDVAYA